MMNAALVLAVFAGTIGSQQAGTLVVAGAQQTNVVVTDTTISASVTRSVRATPNRAAAWLIVDANGDTPEAAVAKMKQRLASVADTLRSWSGSLTAAAPTPQGVIPSTAREVMIAGQLPTFMARSVVRLSSIRLSDMAAVEAALLAAGAAPLMGVEYGATAADSLWRAAVAEATSGADSLAEQVARSLGRRSGVLTDMQVSGQNAYVGPPVQLSWDLRNSSYFRSAPEVTFSVTVMRRHRLLPR